MYGVRKCFDSFLLKILRNGQKIFDLHQNKYHPIFCSPSFAGASDKMLLSVEFTKKQWRSFIRRNMKHFDPNNGYLAKH
jgi:hypothetical protein